MHGINEIKKNKVNLYPLVLVIATLLWGSTFSYTKEIVKSVTPATLITLRFSVTALIMFFIFFKTNIDTIKNLDRVFLIKFLLLGILNYVSIILQTIGLTEISASNSGFLTSLAALFVPFFEFFIRKKRIDTNIKIGVSVALIGVYILSFGLSLPDKFVVGDLLTIICALFFGYQIVLIDDLTKKYHPGSIMFYCFLLTAIASFPFTLIQDSSGFLNIFTLDFIKFAIESTILYHFLALVILGTIVAYVFMALGQKKIDVNKAAIIYLLEPVFASLIAIIFFSEQIYARVIIGGLIIIVAQFIGIGLFSPKKVR